MIRLALIALFILVLILYAFRDWYISLCGITIFTALSQYPELPQLSQIKGLTFWSVTMLCLFLIWICKRDRNLPLPRGWLVVLSLYLITQLLAIVAVRTSGGPSLPAPDVAVEATSTEALGVALLTDHAFALEMIGVLLLAATIGAVLLAKRRFV